MLATACYKELNFVLSCSVFIFQAQNTEERRLFSLFKITQENEVTCISQTGNLLILIESPKYLGVNVSWTCRLN